MNIPHEFLVLEMAAPACAEHILHLLGLAITEHGRATLAVSGGHSPALVFDAMRTTTDFPWKSLHVFFVDERCVPPENKESNYRLANEHLFAPLHFPRVHIHRIDGEIDPRNAAELYALNIQEAFNLKDGELPVFDVIQHGMGADGHTASLFPGEPLIADRTGIAAAVKGPTAPKDRITLLPGVLLASRATIFFLDGEDKRAALQQVLTGVEDPMKYPSQLLSRSQKDVDWFVADLPDITWPEPLS
jgi:6-phosphogluconolactonase